MKESFGQLVRRIRNEKKLTLTQLAAKVDMDSANLSKVETGKRCFDEKRLLMLADALELDCSFLRKEYLSDQIANLLYKTESFGEILALAEQKIMYQTQRNLKQGKLNI